MGHEVAIYSRLELDTDRADVLVIGTEASKSTERLYRLLQRDSSVNLFHIINSLHSGTLDLLEQHRWEADFAVQELEAQLGIAEIEVDIQPLEPKQLRFNKSIQVTSELLQNGLAWTSARTRSNFSALLEHIQLYQEIAINSVPDAVSKEALRNIQSACEMKIELAQSQHGHIQTLRNRVNAQLDVTKALIAQRDTQLNIDIAEAMKRDAEIMRSIAAITMIFLPATFVATFFSMVFFRIGDESSSPLKVDERIWYYPAVTVPITMAIGIWYFVRRSRPFYDLGQSLSRL